MQVLKGIINKTVTLALKTKVQGGLMLQVFANLYLFKKMWNTAVKYTDFNFFYELKLFFTVWISLDILISSKSKSKFCVST